MTRAPCAFTSYQKSTWLNNLVSTLSNWCTVTAIDNVYFSLGEREREKVHTFNIILWGLHISLSHFMIISLSKISVEVHPQICQLLTHSLCSALELDLLCSKGGHVDPGRQSMLSAHQTCHLEVEPSPCRYIRHPSSPSSLKLLSQN